MRSWNYGINTYYKTAHISIDDMPMWVFMLDKFAEFVCDKAPPIPLPPFPIRLSKEASIEWCDDSRWTTAREWYGDLRGWFCCKVHTPITNFCWARMTHITIDVNYKKLKKAFYESDKAFWDEQETE